MEKSMLKRKGEGGAAGLGVLIGVIIAIVVVAVSFWGINSGKNKLADTAKDSESKAQTIETDNAFN